MADAKNKTVANDANVEDHLNTIADDKKRADAFRILRIMSEASGEEATMWGNAIIGFGKRRLTYESGREQDWMRAGFSPRSSKFAFYLFGDDGGREEILSRLGKYSSGKSCLYINKLADVDENVLAELIRYSVAATD